MLRDVDVNYLIIIIIIMSQGLFYTCGFVLVTGSSVPVDSVGLRRRDHEHDRTAVLSLMEFFPALAVFVFVAKHQR